MASPTRPTACCRTLIGRAASNAVERAAWEADKLRRVSERQKELELVRRERAAMMEQLVATVRDRPAHVSIIATGRDAPAALIDVADTVTEMRSVKHAYDAGIVAKKGIDY